MQAMIDLLVSLHRHESTARAALPQMSPHEQAVLSTEIDLVRDSIPKYVLEHYNLTLRSEPELGECPGALAMATLVSVYRALPAKKRRAMSSFFDLAGYRPR
jgi:hypothetical protein